MKKLFFPMLALAAALSFTACSDEPLVNNGGGAGYGEDDGPSAYITAVISLPGNGSRSYTDDEGTTNSNGSSQSGNPNIVDSDNLVEGNDYEEGTKQENEIRSMVLVIATPDNEYITHLIVTGMSATSSTEYMAKAKIPFDVLEDLYGVQEDGKPAPTDGTKGKFANGTKDTPQKVRLFAYCNFTNDIAERFSKLAPNSGNPDWVHYTGRVEEKASLAGELPQSTSSIWSDRSFLMTNAEIYEAEFPGTIDEWTQYADDKNPLNLTPGEAGSTSKPIPVERVAARFDFKQGGTLNEKGEATGIYQITTNIGDFKEGASNQANLFAVEFTRMILVNMAKDFYYLRRVGDENASENAGEYFLCGKETNSNWVVDPHWVQERGQITPLNAGTYYNFAVFDEHATEEEPKYNNVGGQYGWYITTIEDVLSGKTDNWYKGEGTDAQKIDGYHVWRYVTENTLPGIGFQQVQQSTGIIFKARILAGDALVENSDGSEYVSDVVKNLLDPSKAESIYNKDNAGKKPSDFPGLYMFHNMLYAYPYDMVAKAKVDGTGGMLYIATNEIIKNWWLIEVFDDKGNDITPTTKFSYTDYKGQAQTDVEKRVFKYYADPQGPSTAEIEAAKQGVEKAARARAVNLTIEMADQILNEAPSTNSMKDYSAGYAIDFKNRNYGPDYKVPEGGPDDTCPAELQEFENSRFMQLAVDQNITVFVPTDDDGTGLGYFCYYFYWNRHNDNGLNGKMGTMEFAVVRNNVYKLSVTKVASIGHPRNTERDPDPVRPNDPDEDPARSIQVEVKVLPWVVRVNNIEF